MTYFRSQDNYDPDMEQEVEDALRNYYKGNEQSIDPSDIQQSDANEAKKKNRKDVLLRACFIKNVWKYQRCTLH